MVQTKNKTKMALGLTMLLLLNMSWACSINVTKFSYKVIDGELWGFIPNMFILDTKTGQELPGFDLRKVDAKKLKPVTVVDTQIEKASNKLRPQTQWQSGFSYHTDGQYVVWAYTILKNAENEPPVDAASFRRSSLSHDLGVDKDSIYWVGKRVGDNTGKQQINLKTASALNDYILSDGNNLYIRGVYQGSAKGMRHVAGIGGVGGGMCMLSYYNSIWASEEHVFIDDKILPNADGKSFAIKRWIPNFMLDYRDKNGLHLDSGASVDRDFKIKSTGIQPGQFFFGRDATYYVAKPRTADEATNGQGLILIPDLDPQIAQHNMQSLPGDSRNRFDDFITHVDEKTWYVLLKNKSAKKGEDGYRLEKIRLKNKNSQARYDAGRAVLIDGRTLYIVGSFPKQLVKFHTVGKFLFVDYFYGKDDQYVYLLKTGERIKTRDASKVFYDTRNSQLVTPEGNIK